jgi:hypothetical protein
VTQSPTGLGSFLKRLPQRSRAGLRSIAPYGALCMAKPQPRAAVPPIDPWRRLNIDRDGSAQFHSCPAGEVRGGKGAFFFQRTLMHAFKQVENGSYFRNRNEFAASHAKRCQQMNVSRDWESLKRHTDSHEISNLRARSSRPCDATHLSSLCKSGRGDCEK